MRRHGGGFTLLELLITTALLGAMGVMAMMKLATPATLTLPAQAQSAADLLRRAQSVSMVRGQRMNVTVSAGSNGSIVAACTTGTTSPCSTSSASTNLAFNVSQDVVVGMAPGSPSVFQFNSLGQPLDASGTPLSSSTNITLKFTSGGNTTTYTVTMAPITGRVSVSP